MKKPVDSEALRFASWEYAPSPKNLKNPNLYEELLDVLEFEEKIPPLPKAVQETALFSDGSRAVWNRKEKRWVVL